MSTIVTRLGKGTALTWQQADANFTNLNLDKVEESELASATGSSMVGYLPNGTGAKGTITVQDKLRESVSVKDFGAEGDGVTDDTAAIQKAIDYVGEAGGGIVLLPPGNFIVDNGNPGASSWDNKVALWMLHNNVTIQGSGAGATKLTLKAGANAHVIKMGGRASGTTVVSNCSVFDLEIDGNRTNQDTPDESNFHQNGVDVSSGCSRIRLGRLYIHDTMYYGVGFQRDNFEACTVEDLFIERTGADGLDWKDDNGLNRGNRVRGIRVKDFGLLDGIPQQAGIDLRGGVSISGATITGFVGDRTGIRILPSTETNNEDKVRLIDFYVEAAAIGSTIGVHIGGGTGQDDVMVSVGTVRGASVGVYSNWNQAKLNSILARSCSTGIYIRESSLVTGCTSRDCTVGYRVRSNSNTLLNCQALSNTTGLQVDAGAVTNALRGGLFSANGTNVVDNGEQTAISLVAGIRTHSVGTANVPIDSTGTKVVPIAHGLDFAPSLDDVVLTFKRVTNVGDFSLGFFWAYSADATNVYCNVRVLTASATVGATIALVANCVAKKALRS